MKRKHKKLLKRSRLVTGVGRNSGIRLRKWHIAVERWRDFESGIVSWLTACGIRVVPDETYRKKDIKRRICARCVDKHEREMRENITS